MAFGSAITVATLLDVAVLGRCCKAGEEWPMHSHKETTGSGLWGLRAGEIVIKDIYAIGFALKDTARLSITTKEYQDVVKDIGQAPILEKMSALFS